MIQIYHARRTRSIRVIWLAEEMGIPYEVRPYQLGAPSEELTAHNPAGTVPLLIDGDRVLAESVTMLEYLAETYGPTPLAMDAGDARYWQYRQLLMFGEATLTAPINAIVGTMFLAPAEERENFTTGVIRGLIKKRLGVVEKRLKDGPYMLGEAFSLADISVHYPINLIANVPQLGMADLVTPPLKDYHDRLLERPAFQRMLKVK